MNDVMDFSETRKLFNWRDLLKVHPAADLFPLMSKTDLAGFAALVEDIKKNGLQAPIILWAPAAKKPKQLLDGRNRLDVLNILEILRQIDVETARDFVPSPKMLTNNLRVMEPGGPVFEILYGGDPYTIALSLNVHRRHLNAEHKRELIAKVLKAKPEQSNRTIAKQVKADHKTVADVRKQVEATGEIPQLGKTVGADGKARKLPALRKQPKRRLQAALAAVTAAPAGDDDTQPSAEARKAEYAEAEVIADGDACVIQSGRKAALDQLFDELFFKEQPKGPGQTVENFDTLIAALLCQIKGKRPQDFAKTTVAQPLLGDLVHFLREVVTVRKAVAETVADDAAASAEQRKAEYAAGDGAQ
jgi:hypothetical protein